MSVQVLGHLARVHLLAYLPPASSFTLLALVAQPLGTPPLAPALVTLLVLFLVDDIMAEIFVKAKPMNVIKIKIISHLALSYMSHMFSNTPILCNIAYYHDL